METKESLIKTDKSFSALSHERGMNAAFMEYIAKDGVVLRSNNMPIVGKESIAELYKKDDSGFTLTWEPLYAEVAESGELGFTYGIYTLTMQDAIHNGTCVSIWRKNSEGNWKLALDSGNEGLGQ